MVMWRYTCSQFTRQNLFVARKRMERLFTPDTKWPCWWQFRTKILEEAIPIRLTVSEVGTSKAPHFPTINNVPKPHTPGYQGVWRERISGRPQMKSAHVSEGEFNFHSVLALHWGSQVSTGVWSPRKASLTSYHGRNVGSAAVAVHLMRCFPSPGSDVQRYLSPLFFCGDCRTMCAKKI